MRKFIYLLPLALLPVSLAAGTVAIKLYPPEVRLHAQGEGQTILLIAMDDEGVGREVTSEAGWKFSDASLATVESSRRVRASHAGSARLTASFDGLTAEAPVEVLLERPHRLSFMNDI